MDSTWLSAQAAAEQLGISVLTLYDWLAQSDRGDFVIRGQHFTVSYFQGGRRGQGRIQIESSEISRLKQAMSVRPQVGISRRSPVKHEHYPGITVPLGRPED
ncbi:DNA-binding protein [uncultured Rubinisphaera sp.]|uniref:DNA-binding protein n=1 Tax=uncultured Rubinisphaera sp. TaxID=1678686 RepID=UPI0030D9779A|tara:strand:- start:232 stop:537 length:306 start_codon:yes stop_codon:yes gene_type:complete